MGHDKDGEEGGVETPSKSDCKAEHYASSASMASISESACALLLRRADEIPSASIFLASSVRWTFARVCAAMK